MSADLGYRYRDLFPKAIKAPAVPAVRQPRYRYPSQRAALPKRCAHCGSGLIVSDVPTVEHPVTDYGCLICTRTAAELVADGWRQGVLS